MKQDRFDGHRRLRRRLVGAAGVVALGGAGVAASRPPIFASGVDAAKDADAVSGAGARIATPRQSLGPFYPVDWGGDAKLRDRVLAAEETIYSDPADPLVNWDERDLAAALEAAGLVDIRVTVEEQTEERLITEAHIGRWFGAGSAGGRPSYRERLLAGGLTSEEAGEVEKLFRSQLSEQAAGWKNRLAWLTGTGDRR